MLMVVLVFILVIWCVWLYYSYYLKQLDNPQAVIQVDVVLPVMWFLS